MSFMMFKSVNHYFRTRRRLWLKFLIAFIPSIIIGLCLFFIEFNADVSLSEVFKEFVNIQLSAIAILISFSIAIITILVSADNPNIQSLKETLSTDCKPLGDTKLNLFQVLMSNITYNAVVEIIYFGVLFIFIFLQMFVPDTCFKFLMPISIFFLVHILHILLESVGQMYLTFWKHEQINSDN